MKNKSVEYYLESDDPLSDEACNYLLNYNEEDLRVDYKERFNHSIEKSWIDLSVDVVSFANTYGGYLVFGVKDKTYGKLGLDDQSYNKLCDVKQVLEKINRGVQPKLNDVRTKGRLIETKKYVFLYVPVTMNRTHVFEQNMTFRPASKDPIILVRQGGIYIRKSGANQILTSDGFEEILHRRIQRYKNKILEGLTRVVSSDLEQEVVIVTPEQAQDGTKTFKVSDSSDAMIIKGAKLTIQPETFEEKVSAWIAINKTDKKDLPTQHAIMGLYASRQDVKLSEEQNKYIVYFSLISHLPVFFWLKEMDKKQAKQVIEDSYNDAKNIEKSYIISVSGFYGVDFYEKLRGKFSHTAAQINVPKFKNKYSLFKTNTRRRETSAEVEASALAKKLTQRHSMQDIYCILKIDCALYAPF